MFTERNTLKLLLASCLWNQVVSAAPGKIPGLVTFPLIKTFNPTSESLSTPNALYQEEDGVNVTSSIHSLGLDIEGNDYGYTTNILIGTPPREFKLLVDSGSSYLWVGGEGCLNMEGTSDCSNHTLLGPTTSSTFKDTGDFFYVRYGGGAIGGHVVTDHINFAGIDIPGLTFAVALREAKHYTLKSTLYDGILGLARLTPGDAKFPPLLDTLHDKGLIAEPIVSYKIPRAADNLHDGEVAIGGLNPLKFKPGTAVTLPNTSPARFWEVTLERVVVNGIRMTWGTRDAIFDTGSTFILGPRKDIAKLHTAIPGAKYKNGAWAVPCHTDISIALTFGGRTFPIPPRDLPLKPVDDQDPNPDGLCLSRIGEMPNASPGRWIIGDVFLKNIYFSTHLGTNEVTIAELA
ncbi:hypothetical protein ONZ45_g14186 [Pleurotus djamor]|nr:hypothetical protein ONZ45_g14186 [Pleurotus djamor]